MPLPPGPRTPSLWQAWTWIRRPLPLLDRCARRFGGRFTLRIGPQAMVVVSDPEDVRAAFTATPEVLETGGARRYLRPFLTDGSNLVMDGEEHRRHRRLLLPPFHGERMRAYGDVMRETAARAVATWPVGRPFRAIEPLRRITQDVIFQAIFGVRDEARREELRRETEAFFARVPQLLLFIPALRIDLGPLSRWGRFLRRRRAIFASFQREIDRARAGNGGDGGAGGGGGEREDVLALLVRNGGHAADPLQDHEIRAELVTLLVAGHESLTAALAWALQWILATPGVLDRVRAELREVCGGGPPETAHLARLRYLEAAILETLRVSPPFPVVLRRAPQATAIGGVEIPAGAMVAPCPYLAHRRPETHPDPERFDPERFLGERRPGPFEYFPFGGGNRLCVGLSFATYEMKAVIATVLARADLALAAPATRETRRKGILLEPEHGTPVVVVRRV